MCPFFLNKIETDDTHPLLAQFFKDAFVKERRFRKNIGKALKNYAVDEYL